jgi:apolipoprotein D and lipocalin family protein
MEETNSRVLNLEDISIDIDFLRRNDNPLIIKYIANKYGLRTSSSKNILEYLSQYKSYPPKQEIERKIKLELQQNFDPERYMGLWYTAARIPQFFDRNTPWETAEYEIIKDGLIKVKNTAYNKNNSIKGQIIGTAEVIDDDEPAALYVSFPTGRPRPSKIYPNYLINKTDYDNYSVVGSLDGKNLYFLVRERPISENLYSRMLAYAKHLGYDVTKLVQDYGAIDD